MIKKVIVSSFLALLGWTAQSQNIAEALDFSTEKLSGTARFTGMSGAFGALGGDISSLKVNPAGSSVFLNNYASFSINNRSYNNDVSFLGERSSNRNNNIDLNQAGAVLVFKNANEKAAVSKFSLGFTYDKTNNFKNSYHPSGVNSTSIADYFVGLANGVPLDLFTPRQGESLEDLYVYLGETNFSAEGYNNNDLQTAYLGYETFIFDAVNPGDIENTAYESNVSGNSFQQQYNYISTGLNGKLSVNGSFAINDKFLFGLNLNSHFINYNRTTSFYEEIGSQSEVNEIYFRNELETLGRGFSFQIGGIAMLTDMIRVGASWTSPTWNTISEESTQYLDTYSEGFDEPYVVADPRVINIYPDYQLRTPGKLTGSLGLVFGVSGLLSFDYSYKDYSGIEYDSDFNRAAFNAQNNRIDQLLKPASTYRLGGEYRVKAWSFRGGYRYQESPYENEDLMSELTGYSFGLGYSFGTLKLDFAYDFSTQEYNAAVLNSGLSEPVFIENNLSNYVLTLSFDL
ncbi:OmpP1/FadL family transporter [Mesonia aquimarina]|uniref:OmpP1/FadL family transporter n=1 Tax=Mesonia aquimarina TaxID=1504967 RepID=UPI000EF5B803|nr:outer membrane protein transport protein [Mesonia aquimarina]